MTDRAGTRRTATARGAGVEPLRILQLSDPHLLAGGGLHYGKVDTTAALRRVLDRAAGITSVDVVVASGDLSDDGSQGSYGTLRSLLEPFAADRGAVVICAMGNHDLPDGFEAVLGPRHGVTAVRGRRIVWLDSSVPGAGYGAIEDRQLDWLRSVLAEPAEHGTVVVVHHPPVPAVTPLLAALELQRPAALLEVCAAGDVRAILSGHYHHPLATTVAGIAVLIAPGIANATDVTAAAGHEVARRGSGFALVEVPVAGAVPAAGPVDGAIAGAVRFLPVAVPATDDGDVVFDLAADQVAAIAQAAGLRQ